MHKNDVSTKTTQELKDYLLSSTSADCLGSKKELELQQTPDYLECKNQIYANQRKLALWNGLSSFASIGSTLAIGYFGSGLGDVFEGQFDNPALYFGAGTAAGMTGLAVFSNYQSGQIHNQNNFCQMEAGARKNAEMGKSHAVHGHEVSLASSEYTAQRVGEEVEKALDHALTSHGMAEVPQTALSSIQSISQTQPVNNLHR